MHIKRMSKRSWSMCFYPERLTNAAVAAIGGDQIVCPHAPCLSGRTLTNDRAHASRVLLKGDHLGVETNVASQLPGMLNQEGFKLVLANDARGSRSEGRKTFLPSLI